MNSIWQAILDRLTYKNLAGKRQPRTYTVITTLVLFLVVMAAGMAGLQRYLMMNAVSGPAQVIQITPTVATTPFIETKQISSMQQEDGTPSSCPTDSSKWSLSPTLIGNNDNLIQPACVYQGLEKTIAWALLVREGYSRAQATQQLGFTEMPMRQLQTVVIPSGANNLTSVPVSFIPSNPDFTEWRLNANGDAAVTYALSGCFRTSTIEGNRLKTWGGDYPVICMVVEDAENVHIVYSLNDHIFTSLAKPMRSFLLFGYLSDGNWVWLGTRDDPKLEITDPKANAKERLTVATLFDSKPWDAKWLKDTYHLSMNPLPDRWQSMTDEGEKQAILKGLQ